MPGMPGTFSSSSRVSDSDMHHVPWCMTGSLTSGFLWRQWRGKRSRHSRRMRNPQVYVSGKRPIVTSYSSIFLARANSCKGGLHQWITTVKIDFSPPGIHGLACKKLFFLMTDDSETVTASYEARWSVFGRAHRGNFDANCFTNMSERC